MLTLITYNVQFGFKMKKIWDWISTNQDDADIICLQEFPESRLKEIPQIYNYDFARAWEFESQNFGEVTLYKKSGLQCLNSSTIYLGKSKLEQKIWKHSAQRSCLISNLTIQNKELTIVNLHLVCLAFNSHRRKQLKIIIDSLSNKSKPTLFVGDFNYSNKLFFRKLIKFMQSNNFSYVENNYQTNKFPYLGFLHQVDHIFFRNCSIHSITSEKIQHSDHYPLILKFNLD